MPASSSLGLPDPTSIQFDDQELVQAYAAFHANLTCVSETAVVCDPHFFDGVIRTREEGRSTVDLPRLKLLAALVCPGPEQVADIRRRSFAVDNVDRLRGHFTGHVYDQLIADALRSFQEFSTSVAGRALRSERSPGEVLGGITCLLATAPGVTWVSEVQVSTFGDDWALVLAYNDAEDLQEAAFPLPLGFAARGDLPWSVATVLAHDPEGVYVPTDVDSVGWSALDEKLLVLCWSQDEDGMGLGRYLLQLDRAALWAFLRACEGLRYAAIIERVANARRELEDQRDAGIPNIELPAQKSFRQLAEVMNRVDREEDERTRLTRRVAWLATAESELPADVLLQRAAAEFAGLSAEDTREILTLALHHSETAARGAVAVARVRLSLRGEDAYPRPHSPVTALAYGLARRARSTLRSVLSQADANEIITLATAEPWKVSGN